MKLKGKLCRLNYEKWDKDKSKSIETMCGKFEGEAERIALASSFVTCPKCLSILKKLK